jgi:hypothetical protein
MIIVFYYFKTLLGVCKPGAVHTITRLHDHTIIRSHASTVTPAPLKALPCLYFFPPMAEKSKPPALRVVADSKK